MNNYRISDCDSVVAVRQERYEELLHKEALLESIEKLYGKMTDYVFRDAVGCLLKTAVNATVTADE